MVVNRRNRDEDSSDNSSQEAVQNRKDSRRSDASDGKRDARNRKRSVSSDDSGDDARRNDKKRGGRDSSDDESSDKRSQNSQDNRRGSSANNRQNASANNGESYEVYFGDVSFNANEDDVRQHFKNCGQILQVKLLMRDDGKSRGRGFIKFADDKSLKSALKLNGTEMMGRRIVVEVPMNKSNDRRPEGNGGQGNAESSSIIVRNLPFNFSDSDLNDMFESYGAIKSFRVIKNESGQSKGFGFVDFESAGDARAALAKSGSEINGRSITVDFSLPKGDRPFGGGRGGFGGGRGGGRGGFGGGRGGGRGGYGGDRGGRDDYAGRPSRGYNRRDD